MNAILIGAEYTSGGTMVPPEGFLPQGFRRSLRVEPAVQHAGPGCRSGQPGLDKSCEVLLAP